MLSFVLAPHSRKRIEMTTKFLAISLGIFFSSVLNGCGDSEDETAESTSSTPGSGGNMMMSPENQSCDPSEPDSSTECPEYVSCAKEKCQPAYEMCLGTNYLTGDFSGATCKSYMECSTGCSSGNTCDSSCAQGCFEAIEASCLDCLVNTIGGCVTDMCSAELQMCAGANTGTGANTGASGGSAGIGIMGTCEDLASCCASLADATKKADCESLYNGTKAGGDIACGVALTTYTISGSCTL